MELGGDASGWLKRREKMGFVHSCLALVKVQAMIPMNEAVKYKEEK